MWRDMARPTGIEDTDLQVFFEFVEGDDETAILYYPARGHVIQQFGGGAMEHLSGLG
jgi:hypothetical protein